MDLQKLIETLKEKEVSDEVIKFVEGLKTVNSETVKDYLENNEEGKKLSQSLTDARVTKGIESFKTNNFQKLVDEEISKRYPPETAEAKKLRELEKRVNDQEREIKRKDLQNFAIKKATEKGLPSDMIDRFIAEDEEGTEKNISLFKESFDRAVGSQVIEKFKQGGREPGANASVHTPPVQNNSSELTKGLLELV
jgi:hypothetical protein